MKAAGNILLRTPRFDVVCQNYRGDKFYYVQKNDGVSAICINETGGILLLTADRLNTVKAGLELPGGRIESGENPVTAICREINEETGIQVNDADVEPLTSTMPLPSLANETIHVYLLRNAKLKSNNRRDVVGREGILHMEFYSRQLVLEKIRSGLISSAIDGYSLLYYLCFSSGAMTTTI